MSFYVPMIGFEAFRRIFSTFLPIIEHLRCTILKKEKKKVLQHFFLGVYFLRHIILQQLTLTVLLRLDEEGQRISQCR